MTAVTAADGPERCPDLALLELAPLADHIREHVDTCAPCKLVVTVIAERAAGSAGDGGDEGDCETFDPLLAARGDGTLHAAGRNLLARHLAGCASCREVAGTVSPVDAEGDHDTLPEVEHDNYQVDEEVGRGGMGRILAARDRRIGRRVALKELLESSPQLAARFEREARLTARLQHPGIVPIYEIGKWPDGTPFYSMRMVEGRQLRTEIEGAATLPERLALMPSLIAACEAVAFAHSKRVIHRDLTPSNILVGQFGETVVIDWGLAKDLRELEAEDGDQDPSRSDRLTSVGAIVGTIAYMPPEQAYARPVDERADVYSLGAILYHLLAGVPPYRGTDSKQLLREVKTGPPPPIDQVTPGSPLDLVSIVNKAMAREAEDRYPTARELADELERFQTGRMVEAHHYSRGELVKRFLARNRAAVTVTVTATLILLVLGIVAVRRIIASSADARAQAKDAKDTARALLFEKGRIELLDGEPLRALAYLHEAAREGETGPELDLLLARALTDLGSAERPLDCGSDDRHVDISRDGSLLVAACHDRAKVWRVRDAAGKDLAPVELATLEGSQSGFDNLRFSHDGKRLATWGDDGIVRVWRVADFTKAMELPHGTSTITTASFSPDDRLLSTSGIDGYARVWDLETGAQRFTIAPRSVDPTRRLAFGRLTTSLRDDRRVTELLVLTPMLGKGHRYDVDTKTELAAFEIGRPVLTGDLSHDGRLAVACGRDANTVVIDVESGKQHAELAGHTDVVWKCVFSTDGSRVLTSSHDRTAKVWDIAGAAPKLIATANHGELVWVSRFSHDGTRFFTVSPGRSIKVWDVASGGLLATYDSRGKDGRFLLDGRFAALRGDGRIQLWGRESVRLASFEPASNPIVDTTPDGDVVTTDGDDEVAVWRRDRIARTWHRIGTRPLRSPIATTRGRIAAVSDRGVAVFDLETGSTVELPIEKPDALQITGTRLAVMWASRTEIWDLATKARVLALPDADHVVLDASGRRAAAWNEREARRSRIVVWDVDRGARVRELDAIDARPLAFTQDGKRLVVLERTNASQAASVFDVESGVRIIPAQPIGEITPALDPTGRWLTTIDKDRIVVVWDVADGSRRGGFSGLPLQSAQANGDGTLLVAIGEYGRAVLVVSPKDGRILARHPIAHERPLVGLGSFTPPRASARWTSDSKAFTSTAKTFAMWSASHDFTAQAIAGVVRKRVPWQIVNGALEKIRDGKIAGRVTRDGAPVAGVAIEVLVRSPADLTDKAVSWESMKAKLVRRGTTTDAGGRFVIDGLELGELEYRVSAWDGTRRVDVRTSASRADDDSRLELELR